MNTRYSIIALPLLAALGGGAYMLSQRGAHADSEAASTVASSVLVQTVLPRQQSMALTMPAFGDVAPAKVESLSFPQAGHLIRLAVVPGQAVRRGDVLATLTSDPNAQTAYEQAQTALAFAQREQRRLQDLLALQLATQSQVDAAAKQVRDAQAALDAQSRLGGGHGSAQLLAPADGMVTAVPVAQGDRVAAGATIVQLGLTGTLRVMLEIEPARSAELKPGMQVMLSVPDRDATVAAQIKSLQPLVDPKTQMAGAVAELAASSSDGLAPGMHLQASIVLGNRTLWNVPRQAVLADEQGAYLFQVAQDKARRVPVQRVVEQGANAGVDGKLDAALPVVVVGNYELQDGGTIRSAVR